jgi:hypothetical protein
MQRLLERRLRRLDRAGGLEQPVDQGPSSGTEDKE